MDQGINRAFCPVAYIAYNNKLVTSEKKWIV